MESLEPVNFKKCVLEGVSHYDFFYSQPKSVITSRWSVFGIVSDSHGLDRGCDLVPHINTSLRPSIYFVFSVNSKHKINHN